MQDWANIGHLHVVVATAAFFLLTLIRSAEQVSFAHGSSTVGAGQEGPVPATYTATPLLRLR